MDWTIFMAMIYGVITCKIWDSDVRFSESLLLQLVLLIITSFIYGIIK